MSPYRTPAQPIGSLNDHLNPRPADPLYAWVQANAGWDYTDREWDEARNTPSRVSWRRDATMFELRLHAAGPPAGNSFLAKVTDPVIDKYMRTTGRLTPLRIVDAVGVSWRVDCRDGVYTANTVLRRAGHGETHLPTEINLLMKHAIELGFDRALLPVMQRALGVL